MSALEIILLILLLIAAGLAVYFYRQAKAWEAAAYKWHAASGKNFRLGLAALAATAVFLVIPRLFGQGEGEAGPSLPEAD